MRSKFLKGYEWRQDGEYAWYMLMYYPVICKVDLRTNRINKHILIPNKYYVNTVCQYRHCIKKLNYLYCVPDFGKYILRYDELEGNFSAINLGCEGRFRDCYLKDNFLYMYSSNGARLLIVELEQFKVVDDIKIEENTAGFLSMSPSELGLWFACGNNSRIAYFGFEDRKVNYITLEGVEEAIVDIFISNDILFLGNGKNSIFMCKCNNINSDYVQCLKVYTDNIKLDERLQYITYFFAINNKTYIISGASLNMCVYDCQEDKKTIVPIKDDTIDFCSENMFVLVYADKEDYIIWDNENNMYAKYNINEGTLECIDISYDEIFVKNLMSFRHIQDEEIMGLDDFVECV